MRRSTLYNQQKLVYRAAGAAHNPILSGRRSVFEDRLYNWYYNPAVSPEQLDFGGTDATNGVLHHIPVNAHENPVQGDSLRTYPGNFNQHKYTFDANRKVYMWPSSYTHRWKNNSNIQIIGNVYVFEAVQDIPKNATGTSDYSPVRLWTRYTSGTYPDYTGGSNINEATIPSDKGIMFGDAKHVIRRYWKLRQYKRLQLMPGDEAVNSFTQRGRTIDLRDIQDRFYRTLANYGLWAVKGDLITVVMWHGGIAHNEDTPGVFKVDYAGNIGEGGIDLLIHKTFKGVLKPQTSQAFIISADTTTGFAGNANGVQYLPSISSA